MYRSTIELPRVESAELTAIRGRFDAPAARTRQAPARARRPGRPSSSQLPEDIADSIRSKTPVRRTYARADAPAVQVEDAKLVWHGSAQHRKDMQSEYAVLSKHQQDKEKERATSAMDARRLVSHSPAPGSASRPRSLSALSRYDYEPSRTNTSKGSQRPESALTLQMLVHSTHPQFPEPLVFDPLADDEEIRQRRLVPTHHDMDNQWVGQDQDHAQSDLKMLSDQTQAPQLVGPPPQVRARDQAQRFVGTVRKARRASAARAAATTGAGGAEGRAAQTGAGAPPRPLWQMQPSHLSNGAGSMPPGKRNSIKDYQMLAAACRRTGRAREEGVAYFNLGRLYQGMERLEVACKYYLQYLETAEKAKDVPAMRIACNHLASALQLQGTPKALNDCLYYHQRHFELSEDPGRLMALCNMGVAQTSLGNHEQAVACFRDAAELADTLEDVSTAALVVFGDQRHFHAAKARISQQLEIAEMMLRMHLQGQKQQASVRRAPSPLPAIPSRGPSPVSALQHLDNQNRGRSVSSPAAMTHAGRVADTSASVRDRSVSSPAGRVTVAMSQEAEVAHAAFLKQINLTETMSDPRSKAVAYQKLGAFHNKYGRYDEAIECFTVALNLAKTKGIRDLEQKLMCALAVARGNRNLHIHLQTIASAMQTPTPSADAASTTAATTG